MDEKPKKRLNWPANVGLENRRLHLREHAGMYRRRVIITKYFLPIVAATLVIALFVWPQLNPSSKQFRLGETTSRKLLPTGLKVKNPRLVGVDGKSQPFVVTAIEAEQKKADDPTIELEKPKADITLSSGSWVMMQSDKGFVNDQTSTAFFTGHVKMFHDDGYEMTGDRVKVDTTSGNSVSDHPVQVSGPLGYIDAQGFELISNGNQLIFYGPAQLILYMKGTS